MKNVSSPDSDSVVLVLSVVSKTTLGILCMLEQVQFALNVFAPCPPVKPVLSRSKPRPCERLAGANGSTLSRRL